MEIKVIVSWLLPESSLPRIAKDVSKIDKKAQRSQKLRLRTLLVVPFTLQLISTVGLVGWLSFRNGQEAVQQLASQVRVEVASRTQQLLENYIRMPHLIAHSNVNALRLNEINLQNQEKLEQHFAHQLQLFPEVSAIYAGTPDGSITYVKLSPKDGLIANTTVSFPRREYYTLDNEGKRRQFVKATYDFDSRTRPWYKLATAKRGQVWEDGAIRSVEMSSNAQG